MYNNDGYESDYRDYDNENESDDTEEILYNVHIFYNEFLAIENGLGSMSDEEYAAIYFYDNHCNEERVDGKLYIGSYNYVMNNYLFNISISADCFYSFPYKMIQNYFYNPDISNNESSLEIMKLEINKDQSYSVVLKTFWIRLIQRNWKRVYVKRIKIIQYRKSLVCQQYFEYNGKYPICACYLPSLYGMMNV